MNQHFEYRGTVVYRRSGLEPPPPLPKQHTGLRKPPNPPKEKCAVCTQFTRQGSTGYTIKETCLVCGHATTTRREMIPQYPFEECPHEDKDPRGSSRSDLFIEFSANSVARFWMRLRWSSKRPVRKFPTRFWTHHWKGFPSLNNWLTTPKKRPLAPRCWTRFSMIFPLWLPLARNLRLLHRPSCMLRQSIANAEGDSSFSMVGEVENYGEDFAGLECVSMEMNRK